MLTVALVLNTFSQTNSYFNIQNCELGTGNSLYQAVSLDTRLQQISREVQCLSSGNSKLEIEDCHLAEADVA